MNKSRHTKGALIKFKDTGEEAVRVFGIGHHDPATNDDDIFFWTGEYNLKHFQDPNNGEDFTVIKWL